MLDAAVIAATFGLALSVNVIILIILRMYICLLTLSNSVVDRPRLFSSRKNVNRKITSSVF